MTMNSSLTEKAYKWFLRKKYRQLAPAFSIESHLTYKERVTLFKLARNAKTIIEIGSYTGASSCCFGAALRETRNASIICIDTWQNDAMSEGSRDTWKEFTTHIQPYKNIITPVRGFSTDMVDEVNAITTETDLLFIDGDHSYEGVKADWHTYKQFIRKGTILVFHDYGWAEGVKTIVNDEVAACVETSSSSSNMWWGIV